MKELSNIILTQMWAASNDKGIRWSYRFNIRPKEGEVITMAWPPEREEDALRPEPIGSPFLIAGQPEMFSDDDEELRKHLPHYLQLAFAENILEIAKKGEVYLGYHFGCPETLSSTLELNRSRQKETVYQNKLKIAPCHFFHLKEYK